MTRPYQSLEQLHKVLQAMCEHYGLKAVAFTDRLYGATNTYELKAYYFDGRENRLYETDKSIIQVLDRVGTGDAFTAGIIYGLLSGKSSREVLDIGLANFKFKHTIEGDVNLVSMDDILALLDNDRTDIKR